jgi:hypothetical protein
MKTVFAIEESETEAAASGWRLIEVDLAVYQLEVTKLWNIRREDSSSSS